jgi:hypothetical protein
MAISNPVIVRVKATGMYLSNDRDAAFKPSDVKRPFASEAAARGACFVGPIDVKCRALCSSKELRERAKESRRLFDERFEIVPVTVEVQIVSTKG